jgi:hypothetical protein
VNFEDFYCVLFCLEGQKDVHLSELDRGVVPKDAFLQLVVMSNDIFQLFI